MDKRIKKILKKERVINIKSIENFTIIETENYIIKKPNKKFSNLIKALKKRFKGDWGDWVFISKKKK